MVAPVTLDFAGDANPLTKEISRIKSELAGLDTSSKEFNAQYKKLMGESALATKAFAASQKDAQAAVKASSAGLVELKAAIIGAGIGTGILAVGAAFKSAIAQMDEFNKTAQKTGISTEVLSGLNLAAQQGGVGIDAFGTALKKLSVNLADLQTGTSEAAKYLRNIGVAAGDDTQTALKKIADAFVAIPDGATKTAIAIALFGKAGADMIPVLNGGSQALEDFQTKAKRLGIVIGSETAKNAEKFNDSIDDMRTAMRGIVLRIADGMMPAMSALAEAFAVSARAGDQWVGVGKLIGEEMRQIAIGATKLFSDFVELGIVIVGTKTTLADFFSVGGKSKASASLQNMLDALKLNREETAKTIALLNAPPPTSTKTDSAKETDELRLAKERAKAAADKFNASIASGAKAARLLREELTPLQKILIDLYKGQTDKIAAFEQIQFLAENQSALEAAYGIETVAAAIKKLQEVADPVAAKMRELAQNVQDSVNPFNELQRTTADLEKLLAGGYISWDTYSEAVFKAQEATKQFGENVKPVKDALDEMGVAAGTVFANSISGLVDVLTDSSKSFREWAASLIKEIGKVLLQLGLLQAAKLAFGGTSVGNLFGLNNALGNAFAMPTGLRHGIYNQPTLFPLPRIQNFAAGGVFGVGRLAEAGPEAVMPLRRDSSGSLGVKGVAPVINVIDQRGAGAPPVEVRTNNVDDRQEITMLIRSEVKRGFADGSMDRTMRSQYGLRRAPA